MLGCACLFGFGLRLGVDECEIIFETDASCCKGDERWGEVDFLEVPSPSERRDEVRGETRPVYSPAR